MRATIIVFRTYFDSVRCCSVIQVHDNGYKKIGMEKRSETLLSIKFSERYWDERIAEYLGRYSLGIEKQ